MTESTNKQVTSVARRKPPAAGKGRKKGSQNKFTASAKEAFALAAQGLGGAKGLERWARENETEFWKLYARLIPIENHVTGANGAPLKVIFSHE